MGDEARVLIVIPAFNEEDALPAVLDELATVVPQFDVLVVDDGSSDATAAVARSAGVPVAVLPFNLGVGGALRTGIRYAVEHGYDVAVQFDADGQHDPTEIKTLLDALDAGADMVVGSRFGGEQTSYQVGAVRWGAMSVLRLAVKLLSGRRFTDTSSGFKAFSRPVLRHFAHNYPYEYLSDTVEALLLACYAGFHVVEVPVQMRERAGGVPSTRNLRLLYHFVRLLVVMATTAGRPLPERTP